MPIGETREIVPFNPEDAEWSDEIRRVYAQRLGLKDDVPLNVVLKEKATYDEKQCIAKLKELLGLSTHTTDEEVIEEANLREPGWNNMKLYLSLGLGIDPTPGEVERAIEERDRKYNIFLRKIAHAMEINRAYETALEIIPGDDDILHTIDTLVGGRQSEVTRIESDERGIFRYDVTTTQPDAEGYTVEYSYVRAEKTEKRKTLTLISEWYYDADGVPVNGTTALHYLSGAWVLPVERQED